jgi:hypothetical protein
MDAQEDRIANARLLIETRLGYAGAFGCHPDAVRSEWA